MFNIGPFEFLVLAIVGLIVLGPDRLPGLAKDAARMLRTLRELATGARQQLKDELGPEFADVDLRNLNPRTAVQRAVFGDDVPDLRKYDPRRSNPGAVVRDAIFGEDDAAGVEPTAGENLVSEKRMAEMPVSEMPVSEKPVSMVKPPVTPPNGTRPRPRPRPGPGRNYDDVT